MKKSKLVVIGIDDITRIFADYASSTGFPEDAKCTTLLFHPTNHKMRLLVESESLSGNEPPEQIRFDLQRTHLVGRS